MKKINHYEFYNDLLKVTCSSKNSEVEQIFLKFAKDYDISVSNFIGSKAFPKDEIAPEVFKSLQLLNRIREKLGESASPPDVIKYLVDNSRNLLLTPYLKLFAKLYQGGKYQKILIPFAGILKSIVNLSDNVRINEDKVFNSLDLIEDKYQIYLNKSMDLGVPGTSKSKKIRKTKSDLRKEFFKYTFKNFTKEMTYNLSMNDKEEVANFVSNGGLLSPDKLERFFGPNFKDMYYIGIIESKIKEVFSQVGVKNNQILFGQLRNWLLYISNTISTEEYKKYEEEEQEFDIMNLLDKNEEVEDEEVGEDHSPHYDLPSNTQNKTEQILGNEVNLIYLFLVSSFLTISYQEYYRI